MTDRPHTTDIAMLSAEERADDATTVFGFFAYLMSDFVLFAGLFATYAVFRGSTAGGPAGSALFNLPYVLTETLLLLTSSVTVGMALLAASSARCRAVLGWLGATAALGAAFVAMEAAEFARLVAAGQGPGRSGFLSAYFTLVGTHGLHVAIGLLWMIALIIVIARRGLARASLRKLALLALFWHFLDIVWIFIFTIVYLMGNL
jgi:cytochrome o ubiquinol oxidase subunit 3